MDYKVIPVKSIAAAVGTTLFSTVITAAFVTGAYFFGVESTKAKIYEVQVTKLEVIIGIVDQAKARELRSCAETGRSDCLSTIEPITP